MRLILASKSPRRRQLISQLGFDVTITDLSVDETIDPATPIAMVAETIARRKASAYPVASLAADEVLVTADTVVALDGQKLGKPQDRNEAILMLQRLSGRGHQVYSGVCLCDGEVSRSFTETTDVYFRNLRHEEIEHYVDTYRPFDKAGAYGIQEWIGMVGIERIDGDYYNVVGLPLFALYRELASFRK